MNQENPISPEKPTFQKIAGMLLWGGAFICLLLTIDSLDSLPISMPRSWYVNREFWVGLGVASVVGGFLLQRPPKGDEYDTT